MRRKFVVFALLVTLQVASSPNFSAAASLRDVSVKGAWTSEQLMPQINPSLPWSKSSVAKAKTLIATRKQTLQADFQSLKKSGSTIVVVRWVGSQGSNPLNMALPAGKQLRKFSLAGRDSTGVTVDTLGDLPSATGVQGLEDLLVRPVNDMCSLNGFNLFDFATWFQSQCDIYVPSPQEFLQYSLISKLGYVTSDLYQVRISQLQYISGSNLSYSTDANFIHCPQLSKLWAGTDSIPLNSNSPLQGYKISMDGPGGGFVFSETKPNLNLLASLATWNPKTHNFFSNF